MERVFNFSAGPSMLPETVLTRAAEEMLCYQDSGMSVMEMSHRSPVYEKIITDAETLLRRVMTIPDNYKWSIRSVSGGGYVIEHKTSGFYLTGISSTANPSSVYIYRLNTPGTDAYKKQVWRVANENYYKELGGI